MDFAGPHLSSGLLTFVTNMNEDNSPDTSLTRSVATESLADLLGNISETTLDSFLEEGLLRDIPVIGALTGIIKAGRDIRDRLFLRKIIVFLKGVSESSVEERARFVAHFDSDEKRLEFGQAILMLLDRSEDMKKPSVDGQNYYSSYSRAYRLHKSHAPLCNN